MDISAPLFGMELLQGMRMCSTFRFMQKFPLETPSLLARIQVFFQEE